eukprot:6480-Heterococcus_DN1.PRE.1
MSSARNTFYDPQFDPRLRRLVQEVLVIGRPNSDTADAFSEAGCTTLETVKTLTDASPCLQRFPAKQRSAFLQQVAAADITGTGQITKFTLAKRIVWTSETPIPSVFCRLYKHKQSRLSNAKVLTHESECLQGVPSQAVDRFLELAASCTDFNQRSNLDFIKVYLMMLSCLHTSLRITDEEELSGTSKTIGCCDRDEIEIIAYPDTYKVLQGYGAVILGALWGAKSTTLKAASKLTMSSH